MKHYEKTSFNHAVKNTIKLSQQRTLTADFSNSKVFSFSPLVSSPFSFFFLRLLWNWKNPLLGFFAGIILRCFYVFSTRVLRFSTFFYVFLRFSTLFYVFLRFSTFSPFFKDSTALFLRFSRFSETVQHFFSVFFERNWDSATTANPVCPSAAPGSEIALLRPIRNRKKLR